LIKIGLGLNSKDTKLEKERIAFVQVVEQNGPNPLKLGIDKKLLKPSKPEMQMLK
jgi:hypothetical protein